MPVIYNTNQAARLAGISAASIRNYIRGRFAEFYSEFFSTGARPGPGQAREFTEQDIALLAFIRQATAAGASHVEVRKRIQGGELSAFDWQPPVITESTERAREDSASSAGGQESPQQPTAALVLAQAVTNALTAQLVAEARSREDQLHAQIADLQRQIGRLEGELATVKQQSAEVRQRAQELEERAAAAEARAAHAEGERKRTALSDWLAELEARETRRAGRPSFWERLFGR